MTCEDVLGKLDDYVDGTLPEAQLQEIELHLAGCAACREEESRLRRLLDLASALPQEIRPRRDLWPAITARLESDDEPSRERGTRRFWARPVWLAAAAAVLLAVASIVMQMREVKPGDPGAVPTSVAQPEVSGTGHAQQAEMEYIRATGQLMEALDARRDSLSPETRKAVDENLKTIDEALRQVREALEKDPGNRQLTLMLASTHQKKLDLLLRLIRLSSQI
jgi:negative regulator of sigma E activity